LTIGLGDGGALRRYPIGGVVVEPLLVSISGCCP
jgi:hypothetical protein